MAKRRPKNPAPVAGDTFAIPLEGGRFAVCRVLAVNERGDTALVANADWIGRPGPRCPGPCAMFGPATHAPRLARAAKRGVGRRRPASGWLHPYRAHPAGPGEDAIPEPGTGGWPFFRIQPHEQWLWGHPKDAPPPPPPPEGRFILHRFNGDEVYRFESAVMWA